VLNLFSGFLLLLKERLSRHLPELTFKGKVNEVRQKLSAGKTLNTVDLDEALERLEIGPRVMFSKDELEVIRTVQEIRSQFEHYKVSINRHLLWKNVSKFLELIGRFLFNELQVNIEASPKNIDLQKKIHTIDSIRKRVEEQRRKEWNEDAQSRLKKFKRKSSQVIQELELEYRANKGADIPYTTCPDCYDEALITSGEFRGVCINPECNSVNPLTGCSCCDAIMPGFTDDYVLCEYCQGWIDDQ
jgi:hypothetical protein